MFDIIGTLSRPNRLHHHHLYFVCHPDIWREICMHGWCTTANKHTDITSYPLFDLISFCDLCFRIKKEFGQNKHTNIFAVFQIKNMTKGRRKYWHDSCSGFCFQFAKLHHGVSGSIFRAHIHFSDTRFVILFLKKDCRDEDDVVFCMNRLQVCIQMCIWRESLFSLLSSLITF